jgi:SSS family solute:Na+ symporter
MMTVFFYARLWRRCGVMTDIEFTEIRYSGRPAAFPARIPRVVPRHPGQLHRARLGKSGDGEDSELALGVTRVGGARIVLGLIAITSFISALSGLWGVLVTDLVQFAVKMTMVIVLAVAAVHAVGGMDALKMKLGLIDHTRGAHTARG